MWIRQLVWLWLCRSLTCLRRLVFEHAMAVFTVFFVVLAIHFGHWGLLFCYFVIGVVPAVAFCFYVIGSQQLWDVNYIADTLFLSKSSMVTKLQALGPLISSVHKGHADQTDGEIDHGTQHTEETTKSLLNIINTNSNSSSSSNNNALTTTTNYFYC